MLRWSLFWSVRSGFQRRATSLGFPAVALAIALALKDSLGSLANGVIIIFTKPFKKGDYVQINGVRRACADIRLFNTKILTYSNEEIIIPNSEILSTKMINYSTMPIRRVVIDVPVPYDADTAKVKQLLLDSVSEYKYTVKTPAPSVVLKEYGDSALKFSARAWTLNENYWDTLYDLTDKIFNDLKAQGISIPFNRMDVQLIQTASQGAAVSPAECKGKGREEE